MKSKFDKLIDHAGAISAFSVPLARRSPPTEPSNLLYGTPYYATVRATNGAGLSVTANSDGVQILSGPKTLEVFGLNSPAQVGQAQDFTVELAYAPGVVATDYQGTVRFTTTDASATVPPPYVFTAADAGRHTFAGGATFWTVGLQSLTATDTALSSLTGTQSNLDIVSGTEPLLTREAKVLSVGCGCNTGNGLAGVGGFFFAVWMLARRSRRGASQPTDG